MSPSKPLTEKQRTKRKLKRARAELRVEMLNEIAQHNRRCQMPDGTQGFFVPIRRNPYRPGVSLGHIRRTLR